MMKMDWKTWILLPSIMTHSAHNKAQDIGQPIAETIEQADDSIEELEVYEDNIQVQDPNKQVKSHLLQPPDHVDTKAPDPGASESRRSQRTHAKPQQLACSISQRHQVLWKLCCHQHPIPVHLEEHKDQNYILVAHCIMTQCSLKAGIKHFKERAGKKAAVSKELHQLHFRGTFEPVHPRDLTKEELHELIESHMFLKEKQDQTGNDKITELISLVTLDGCR
jgi:hypothetical protein